MIYYADKMHTIVFWSNSVGVSRLLLVGNVRTIVCVGCRIYFRHCHVYIQIALIFFLLTRSALELKSFKFISRHLFNYAHTIIEPKLTVITLRNCIKHGQYRTFTNLKLTPSAFALNIFATDQNELILNVPYGCGAVLLSLHRNCQTTLTVWNSMD